MLKSCALICITVIFALVMGTFDAYGGSTTSTGGQETNAQRIAAMNDFYARLYRQPVIQKDRLARLVGIVSLSRIDGPPLTRELLAVLKDEDLIVAQAAWEGLHARQASLVDMDRAAWLDGGMDIARRGGFPGATVAPLIAAVIERTPASLKGLPELLVRICEENDVATPTGKAALDAARKTIAAWQDPKVFQILEARMTAKPRLAPRMAHLLSGLPDAPQETDAGARRAVWAKYAREAKLTPPAALPAYQGFSAVLPKAEAIKDPFDKKWRKELELEKLKLESVEIAFCIDATPSMAVSNPYVATYIQTISQLFNLLSYRVRSGAVYYRHEVDAAIMNACCKKWQTFAGDFAVKTLPLTDQPGDLVAQMRGMKIGGRGTGHSGNGAYVAGIDTAMHGMQWSSKSKRVIAMTGDAKATPGSEKALVEIATKAKAEGYTLVFIARDRTAAAAVDEASRASLGMAPIQYGDDIKKIQVTEALDAGASAIAEFHGTAFNEMAARVLQQSLPEAYRDRVQPLLRVIVPILQARAAAARASAAAKG